MKFSGGFFPVPYAGLAKKIESAKRIIKAVCLTIIFAVALLIYFLWS